MLYLENTLHTVSIGDIPHCTCIDFTKMLFSIIGNECVANICIICIDLCPKWISTMTNSFMFRHLPRTRLCGYLNLLVL